MKPGDDRIEIRNFISPEHVQRVDRQKYEAVRDALLRVLPQQAPGLTVAEAKKAILPLVSDTLFPGGDKLGWWLKAAQLDLEFRGRIVREASKPLRLHRT